MSELNNLEKIKQKFSNAVISTLSFRGEDTCIIKKESLIKVCEFLRDDKEMAFNFLMDLTAVDYMESNRENRFEVVYQCYSYDYNHSIRVKVPVSEKECSVETVINIWRSADWLEREVYDMYGIKFENHPNMKRILLYEEFVGYPLRKDYPIKKRQPLIGPLN